MSKNIQNFRYYNHKIGQQYVRINIAWVSNNIIIYAMTVCVVILAFSSQTIKTYDIYVPKNKNKN